MKTINPRALKAAFRSGAHVTRKFVQDNLPKLLTAGSVLCLGGAVHYTAKGTVKAAKLVAKAEEEKGAPLTKGEIVKETWQCYIPAAVATLASAGCSIAATSVVLSQNTALVAALAASEAKNQGVQEKINNLLGEGETAEPTEDARVSDIYLREDDVIPTAHGNDIFKDAATGRMFRSSRAHIDASAVNLSRVIMVDGSATLNDLYSELGIPDVAVGDTMGWTDKDWPIQVGYSTEWDRLGRAIAVIDLDPHVLPSER